MRIDWTCQERGCSVSVRCNFLIAGSVESWSAFKTWMSVMRHHFRMYRKLFHCRPSFQPHTTVIWALRRFPGSRSDVPADSTSTVLNDC